MEGRKEGGNQVTGVLRKEQGSLGVVVPDDGEGRGGRELSA